MAVGHRLVVLVVGGLVALAMIGCNVQSVIPGAGGGTPAPSEARAKPGGTGGAPGKPGGFARSVSVSVASVATGPIQSIYSYSGAIQAKQQVNVLPRVASRIEKLTVDVGSEVKAGDIVAELEAVVLDAQVAQTEGAVAAAAARLATVESGPRDESVALATASLQSARQRLSDLEGQGRPEAIAQAEANLKSAEARLAQVRAGPTKQQIDAAEAQARALKNSLYYTEANADAQLGSGRSIFTRQMKEAQAGQIWEQIQAAEANLELLKLGPAKEQIDQAEAAVEVARQQLALAQNPNTQGAIEQARAAVRQAEAQLALAKAPFTKNDVDSARAALDQAKAQLAVAKANRNEAFIRAPFDGVIAQRLVSLGAVVGTNTNLLSIISKATELVVNVEEERIGQVRPGMPVEITVPAYPGRVIPGQVALIVPQADVRSHTFPIRIAPNDPAGLLKAGMYGQVRIATDQKESAVLVPREAVVLVDGKNTIFVVADGVARKRELQIGLEDGSKLEAISGAQTGEMVVVAGMSSLTDGIAVVVSGQGSQAGPGGPGQGQRPEGAGGPQRGPGPEGQGGAGPGPGGARPTATSPR